MYYYSCSYVLNHRTFNVHRKFKSRIQAIQYIFRLLPYNSTLLYEIVREDKHNVEYVCNNMNRFWISRERY